MMDRLVSFTGRVARREFAVVAVWAAVNVVLAIVFTALLHFDDSVAHAVGF
jgi:uncharacterized membrane protein YhaH (DUF805 family)